MRIESVAKLPQVAEIRFHIVRGESELAVLKQRYLPEHPKYIQALSQIGNLKQSLAAAVAKAGDSVEKRYQAAVETEQKLDAALKEQEKVALDLNKISIPYNVLAREVASDRSMYDAVMTRLRETTVTQSLDKTPFRIVEFNRESPRLPIKPNKAKVLLTALLLSLAAGSGSCWRFDSIDAPFRSVDEIEKSTQPPSHRCDTGRRRSQEPQPSGNSSKDRSSRSLSHALHVPFAHWTRGKPPNLSHHKRGSL